MFMTSGRKIVLATGSCLAVALLVATAFAASGEPDSSGFAAAKAVHDGRDSPGYLDMKSAARGTALRHGDRSLAFSATTYARWSPRSLNRCKSSITFNFPHINRLVIVSYRHGLRADVYRDVVHHTGNAPVWRQNPRKVVVELAKDLFGRHRHRRPKWNAYTNSPPRKDCGAKHDAVIDLAPNSGYVH
jgi:hypothetical protein